jgi:hypothetical protein
MFHPRDFISFLKHPTLTREEYRTGSVISVFKLTGQAYLFYIVAGVICTMPVMALLVILDSLPKHKPIDLNTLSVLRIIFLTPIIEELIFRLPLKLSKINITISVSLLLFFLVRRIDSTLAISLTVLFLGFMIISLRKQSDFQPETRQLFSKYFYLVFYFQALFFGFLHLQNFYLDATSYFLYPLLIITNILMGFIAGYLRVRYTNGLYACILLHMTINTIACLVR